MDNHSPSSRIRSSVLKNRLVSEARGSHGSYSPKDVYIDIVRSHMQTEPYRKAVRKRKVWIEPLCAGGKLWHGMGRFRTRTLRKVNAEALMTATGQNVRRLHPLTASVGLLLPAKLGIVVSLYALPSLAGIGGRCWDTRCGRKRATVSGIVRRPQGELIEH
jgi:hypothetical protein